MSLAQLIDKKFGVRTRVVVNPVRASIGTTAQVLLSNNPSRLAWIIINTHATQVVYLSFTNDVSSTKGIRLDSAGGSYSMIWDEDFEPTGWAIWGIGSGADTTLYAYEVVEY